MKIERIQVAISYEFDPLITLSLGEGGKNVQKKYNAKVQTINIPNNAPPETPRLMISNSDFVINISLNRSDIFINIPAQINTRLEKILNYTQNFIEGLYKELFEKTISYIWQGLVINILLPDINTKKQRAIKLLEPIFDDLIKIERSNRNLSTFNLQYGFQERGYNRTFTINGFETINLQLSNPIDANAGPVKIGIKEDMISASGISVIIDVNNKTNIKKNDFMYDFNEIINEIRNSKKAFEYDTDLRLEKG